MSNDTLDAILDRLEDHHCDGSHTPVSDGDEIGDYLSCVDCPYIELVD